MGVGSDIFCDPYIQKILQNKQYSTIKEYFLSPLVWFKIEDYSSKNLLDEKKKILMTSDKKEILWKSDFGIWECI